MHTSTESRNPHRSLLGAPRRRNSVLAALEQFRRINPDVSLGHVLVFLYVCENELLSVTEIAIACGFNAPTASRTTRGMFARTQPGALSPYMGLLEFAPDRIVGNAKAVRLTEGGRALRARLDSLIEDAVTIT